MRKKNALWVLVLCGYIGRGAGVLQAQPLNKLGPDEMNFVNATVTYTQMHVKLGRFAAEKAGSADVRRFADRVVEDVGQLQKELVRVTAIGGTAVPLGENNV